MLCQQPDTKWRSGTSRVLNSGKPRMVGQHGGHESSLHSADEELRGREPLPGQILPEHLHPKAYWYLRTVQVRAILRS